MDWENVEGSGREEVSRNFSGGTEEIHEKTQAPE
jgi:hypothetical protein